ERQLSGIVGATNGAKNQPVNRAVAAATVTSDATTATPVGEKTALLPMWDGVAPEWSLGAPTSLDALPPLPFSPGEALSPGEPVTPPGDIVRSNADEDDDLTVTSMGTKDNAFEGPSDFIEKVLPVLKTALAATGLNPLAVLAQGALETGWGAHVIH